MNQIVIKGRLVRDPELKAVGDGVELCSFTVAVDRQGGPGEKVADFFSCCAWRKTAAFVNQYFRKGQEVLLSGSMQSRRWERDGVKHTAWELSVDRAEFCGSKKDREDTVKVDPATQLLIVDEEPPF